MTRHYRAELPTSVLYDRGMIDALLGIGEIRLEYIYEAPSRAVAVYDLSEEFDWRNLDREFWDNRLSGRRTRVRGLE